MKVNIISEEVHYIITWDEICKVFKIPSDRHIDFVDMKIDEKNETIILDQIEPHTMSRPKGEDEK